MTATDDILGSLPIDQLAQEVGASPDEVRQAVAAAVPALLGGLQANAEGGGASSIVEALGQHDSGLLDGGVDLGQVDTGDGAQIASHIFGGNEEQVYSALGANAGGSLGSSLIKKLIPILAPIVLSYIAKQVLGKAGGSASGGSSGGGLGDILGSILGGGKAATPEQESAPSLPTQPGGTAGGTAPGSLEDMLKDVLGSAAGGAASQQAQSPQQGGMPGGNILSDVLGGLLGGGRR